MKFNSIQVMHASHWTEEYTAHTVVIENMKCYLEPLHMMLQLCRGAKHKQHMDQIKP